MSGVFRNLLLPYFICADRCVGFESIVKLLVLILGPCYPSEENVSTFSVERSVGCCWWLVWQMHFNGPVLFSVF
jgi:hypothetical protein